MLRQTISLAAAFALGAAAVAAELDPAPDGSFTIVVIPDTQGYHGIDTRATPASKDPLTNVVLVNHIRWIRENVAIQKIAFVSHVGDIVDRNIDAQWEFAQREIGRLRGVVPFGLVVGNHDMVERTGDSTRFQRYFPSEDFKDFSWYGGSYQPRGPQDAFYGNNVNSYQLFTAGGIDFVILHLECNAPDEVLAWSHEVLNRHKHRRALISTHMDLGTRLKPASDEGFVSDPKGRMDWSKVGGVRGNRPQQMWDKLYRHHVNLGFIFSGDQSRATAMRLYQSGEHGNLVHALLSDYMSAGPLRLYRFLPAANKVQVITYDTTKRQLVDRMPHVPARTEHQFIIDYEMTTSKAASVPASSIP